MLLVYMIFDCTAYIESNYGGWIRFDKKLIFLISNWHQKLRLYGTQNISIDIFQTFGLTYSLLNSAKLSCSSEVTLLFAVFPHIVAAATILFWKFECGNYSREETIQRRKVIFDILTQLRNYINQHQLMFLLLKNIEISAKIVLFLKKTFLFHGNVL